MKNQFKYIVALITIWSCFVGQAQQDPQFTQYMYNTLSVNPGYTGSRGHLAFVALHRSQWVGINGAPTTQTFSLDTPVGKNVGLGLNFTNDELGPSNEIFFDANFSYTLRLNDFDKKLSFGLKGGGRRLNVDFSKGTFNDPDAVFQNNIENKFFPSIGAGVYYHTDKSYLGFSVPNFLSQEHYDGEIEGIATERLHYFLIGGKVFDLSNDLRFKPAFFVKWVPGAPIIADITANMLIKETLTLGAAYRWDDSVSGLIGLRLTESVHFGYSYDFTTTELSNYNNGTHELFFRFEFISNERKLKSPRFF